MNELVGKYPKYKMFSCGRARVFSDRVEKYSNKYIPSVDKIGLVDYFKVISKTLRQYVLLALSYLKAN